MNGEGEDAGVVYCEMQGRENMERSRTHLNFTREMYPGHCGYKVTEFDVYMLFIACMRLPHHMILRVVDRHVYWGKLSKVGTSSKIKQLLALVILAN